MSTVSWVVLSIICTVGGLLFGVAVGLFLANPARERGHYRQAHQHAHPTPRAIAALRRAPRGVFRAANDPLDRPVCRLGTAPAC